MFLNKVIPENVCHLLDPHILNAPTVLVVVFDPYSNATVQSSLALAPYSYHRFLPSKDYRSLCLRLRFFPKAAIPRHCGSSQAPASFAFPWKFYFESSLFEIIVNSLLLLEHEVIHKFLSIQTFMAKDIVCYFEYLKFKILLVTRLYSKLYIFYLLLPILSPNIFTNLTFDLKKNFISNCFYFEPWLNYSKYPDKWILP